MNNEDSQTKELAVPDLLARMMGKSLFFIESKMIGDPIQLNDHLREHLQYMISLEKRGVLFLSGPLYDEAGQMTGDGVTVLRAESFGEADKLARGDPFFKAGLRDLTIRRWVLNEGRLSFDIDLSDCYSNLK